MKAVPASTDSVEDSVGAVGPFIRGHLLSGLAGDSPLLYAFDHHFSTRGKRTRSRLSLHCSAALGLPDGDAIGLAACVEALHNASLIQDDLQDGSEFRRGRAAVWKRFGADDAICLTNSLLSTAFACLADLSDSAAMPALIRCLQSAVVETADGQARDLKAGTSRPDPDRSLASAAEKSGPLFALALELPLIAAGQQIHCAAARAAAVDFGCGYQIIDDLKDLEADRESGSGSNVVLALEERLEGTAPARAEAVRLAAALLESAGRHAFRLPHGSGALLVDLASALQAQLQAFDG